MRKARKGPRQRGKIDNVQITNDACHESPPDEAQDIIVETRQIDPLQTTQLHETTEEIEPPITQQDMCDDGFQNGVSIVEGPAQPAEATFVDDRVEENLTTNHTSLTGSMPIGTGTIPWNGEVTYPHIDNGTASSTHAGQVDYDGTNILSSLFDTAHDPFLAHGEWGSGSNSHSNLDQVAFLSHEDWHPHQYQQYASPPFEMPDSTAARSSAVQLDNLPVVVDRRQDKAVAPFESQAFRTAILDDLRNYISAEELEQIRFPSTRSMHRYSKSYVKSLHCHLPVLHITQILGSDTPSPLRLAILAIGALYLLDRRIVSLYLKLANKAMRNVRIKSTNWLLLAETMNFRYLMAPLNLNHHEAACGLFNADSY